MNMPGQGMMGQGMMGQNHAMMGNMGMMAVHPADATPIPRAEAIDQLEAYAQQFGPDVQVSDVMAFTNNYYAQLVTPTGEGVGEVLLGRYNGLVMPEPGPNMMWNTNSAMRSAFANRVQVDQAAAEALAETFLETYLPDATVTRAQQFPGYYTFDYGRGTTEGMLSVNAYSGEVWVHTWHGTLLSEHD
jgi:hypothetical protein